MLLLAAAAMAANATCSSSELSLSGEPLLLLLGVSLSLSLEPLSLLEEVESLLLWDFMDLAALLYASSQYFQSHCQVDCLAPTYGVCEGVGADSSAKR
jgi:hypothetical protein